MKLLKRSCSAVYQLHAAAAEGESSRQLQVAGAPPQAMTEAPPGRQTTEQTTEVLAASTAASTAAAEGELVLEARRQAEYVRQLKDVAEPHQQLRDLRAEMQELRRMQEETQKLVQELGNGLRLIHRHMELGPYSSVS